MSLRQLLVAGLWGLVSACGNSPTLPESTATAALARLHVVPKDALNADVRQDSIQQTICVAGYTASVRPSTTYTNGVKLKLLREYGLTKVENMLTENEGWFTKFVGGRLLFTGIFWSTPVTIGSGLVRPLLSDSADRFGHEADASV